MINVTVEYEKECDDGIGTRIEHHTDKFAIYSSDSIVESRDFIKFMTTGGEVRYYNSGIVNKVTLGE